MTQYLAAPTFGRRDFLTTSLLVTATVFLPAMSRVKAPSLRLITDPEGDTVKFRVFLEGFDDHHTAVQLVQVFALGERNPVRAEFKICADQPAQMMSGKIRLSRDQNVMALAQFEDGSLLHTRSFVSVS